MDLIKSVIDKLACPAGKRDMLVFDAKLPGFGLRVSKSGLRMFFVQYSRGGQTKRVRIGRYGILTPAEARRHALRILGEIEGGADPLAEKKQKRAAEGAEIARAEKEQETKRLTDAFTISVLLDRWVEQCLVSKSASYRRDAPRAVRGLLGDRVSTPAASLSTDVLQALADRKVANAPVQVVNAKAYGRAAWNWALKRRLVLENPFAAMVVEQKVKARDRALSDVELGEAWRAAQAQPAPFGPILQLLILTLQRRSEVAGMRWSELNDDLSIWTIPKERAKNNRAHIVYLAAPSRQILGRMQLRREEAKKDAEKSMSEVADSDFVFTTTSVTPVSGLQKARRAMDLRILEERAETEDRERLIPPRDWRLHDFRRTGVTKLAELGISPHVADKVLNHVTGTITGVAAVYQKYEFMQERQRALDIWASHVLAVGSGRAVPNNVLRMSPALARKR